jgi:hypothetical protein
MDAWRNMRDVTSSAPEPDGEFQGINTWKRRHMLLVRTISLTLSVLFLHQQIVMADGGELLWANALKGNQSQNKYGTDNRITQKDIEIPNDVAEKQDSYDNGDGRLIVQVQDAHASLAAQYSIVKFLDSLVTNYDLRMIALEGANGYLDTSILQTFPNKDIKENTAAFLMKEGRMSAGEFFAITRDDKDLVVYGVEDDKLYNENLASFRTVAEERAGLIALVDNFQSQLDALAAKALGDDLKKLNKISRMHKEGRVSFIDYWKEVGSFADRLKVPATSYAQVQRLIETIELEKTIDFAAANLERRELIDELGTILGKDEMETLVLKSVAFKQNRISQASFHKYLVTLAEKHRVSSKGYANLIRFTQYVTMYEAIDIFELYLELAAFETALREKMYRNDDERVLCRVDASTRLLKRLYSMELSNGDFNNVRSALEGKDYDSGAC